jgi:hypothetical protein
MLGKDNAWEGADSILPGKSQEQGLGGIELEKFPRNITPRSLSLCISIA